MAVQHNVINGICAGCKYSFCASHSVATASASGNEGSERGRPNGVRSLRLSSVTVYQLFDDDVLLGLRSDAQFDLLDMEVVTPVALCVPSTPAEIGDCTSPSIEVLLLLDVVDVVKAWSSVGGDVDAMLTCL